MKQAAHGDVVRFRTRLFTAGGRHVEMGPPEGSVARLGAGDTYAGVERRDVLEPGEVFGPYDPRLRMCVARSEITPTMPLAEGENLRVCFDDGQIKTCRVDKVTPEQVCLDANHAFAGEMFVAEVTLLGFEERRTEKKSYYIRVAERGLASSA
jgi:FKBP-type peptidyl-prolyl cis-trans isomerase 2